MCIVLAFYGASGGFPGLGINLYKFNRPRGKFSGLVLIELWLHIVFESCRDGLIILSSENGDAKKGLRHFFGGFTKHINFSGFLLRRRSCLGDALFRNLGFLADIKFYINAKEAQSTIQSHCLAYITIYLPLHLKHRVHICADRFFKRVAVNAALQERLIIALNFSCFYFCQTNSAFRVFFVIYHKDV